MAIWHKRLSQVSNDFAIDDHTVFQFPDTSGSLSYLSRFLADGGLGAGVHGLDMQA